jgi:molybdopterin-guanine dinucleotide biosynthesis protein A
MAFVRTVWQRRAMQHDAVAAILGGGAGARMGRRKALVALAGRPLVAHVAAALRPSAHEMAVVGDVEAARAIGAAELADPPGFPAGPLSGISAALSWAASSGAKLLLVAPCDTPLLTGRVFERLREEQESHAQVACAETPDGLQPLVSIWRTDRADWLRAELAGGHPPVRDIMLRAGLTCVRFDDADMFLNVNTPADLQRAEAILLSRRI